MQASQPIALPLQRLIEEDNRRRRESNESFSATHVSGINAEEPVDSRMDSIEIFKLSLELRSSSTPCVNHSAATAGDPHCAATAGETSSAATAGQPGAPFAVAPAVVASQSAPQKPDPRDVLKQLAVSEEEPTSKYHSKIRPQDFMGGLLGASRW